MPYIIATRYESGPDVVRCEGCAGSVRARGPEGQWRCDQFPRCASRRAEATLEEARESVAKWMHYDGPPIYDRDEWERLRAAALELPESGGTVGPLPDGTVIEVVPETWQWLDGQIGTVARYLREPDGIWDRERAIVRAFNARS